MADLTRRHVLGSLGGALALACAVSDGVAVEIPPAPTLESVFGEARFAHLNEQFERRRTLPYGDIQRRWLLDESGLFGASPEFRSKFTAFLVGGQPFQMMVEIDDLAQHLIDANILLVFWKYRVVATESRSAFYDVNEEQLLCLWQVWRGDDWKKAGWSMPPPERIPNRPAWYWPRPEAA